MNLVSRAKLILKKAIFKKKHEEIALTTCEDIENNFNNCVFLDLGNSEIKAIANKKKVKFKSCIKRVNDNEITIQNNAFKKMNEWYIVGDDNTPLNSSALKVDRKNIEELILYTIANLDIVENAKFKNDSNGITNINLYMLLPFNQLYTEEKFKMLLEQIPTKVKINGYEEKIYKINLKRCFAEGEMTLNAFSEKELKKLRPNKIVLDIGGGTVDIFVFNQYNNLINKLPLKMGMRNLSSRYLEVLECKNSNVVNKYLIEKYPFTKTELEGMEKLNDEFLEVVMTDINNIILDFQNPFSTEILCVGGGSKALEKSLKDWFKNTQYKLTFFKGDIGIFSNVKGMENYVKLKCK